MNIITTTHVLRTTKKIVDQFHSDMRFLHSDDSETRSTLFLISSSRLQGLQILASHLDPYLALELRESQNSLMSFFDELPANARRSPVLLAGAVMQGQGGTL